MNWTIYPLVVLFIICLCWLIRRSHILTTLKATEISWTKSEEPRVAEIINQIIFARAYYNAITGKNTFCPKKHEKRTIVWH